MEEGRLQRLRFIAIITLVTKPGHQEFDHRAKLSLVKNVVREPVKNVLAEFVR